MDSTQRAALDAQIERQTAELQPVLLEFSSAQLPAHAAHKRVQELKSALDALVDQLAEDDRSGDALEARKAAAAELAAAQAHAFMAWSHYHGLSARVRELNSAIESCQAAIAADPNVFYRDIRPQLIERIKAAAGAHILLALPDWKQRNMTASALQLTRIAAARPLTAEEAAQDAALESAWAWVTAVRAASDALEAAVAALTPEQSQAWTMPAFPAWPA